MSCRATKRVVTGRPTEEFGQHSLVGTAVTLTRRGRQEHDLGAFPVPSHDERTPAADRRLDTVRTALAVRLGHHELGLDNLEFDASLAAVESDSISLPGR